MGSPKNGKDLVENLTYLEELLIKRTDKELWDPETYLRLYFLDNFLAKCHKINLAENWEHLQDHEKLHYKNLYFQFVRFFADSKRVYTESKDTFLHLAIEHCHLLVDDLLLLGADPNACNALGQTSLHVAAQVSIHFILLERLILAGADMNREASHGTPRNYAAAAGNEFGIEKLDQIAKNLIACMSTSQKTEQKMLSILNSAAEILKGYKTTMYDTGSQYVSINQIGFNFIKSCKNSSEFYHYICTAQALCQLYCTMLKIVTLSNEARQQIELYIRWLFRMCGWTQNNFDWDPELLTSLSDYPKQLLRDYSLFTCRIQRNTTFYPSCHRTKI